MKDREELIWKAVKKCKLESAFWKLTKVFPSTEGMVSVLYRRQEQKEQIQKIWCKRIGIAVLFSDCIFILMLHGREDFSAGKGDTKWKCDLQRRRRKGHYF